MFIPDLVGIIADDLTGANDTALQMQQKGAHTKILLDTNVPSDFSRESTQVWAISTESRNIPAEEAYNKVREAACFFRDNFSFEYYFKKIDSTLRGNIAVETLTVLSELDYDAAIVIPAFPAESRITVGGYHLLNELPISMSEMAVDPVCPVLESHIPTMFKNQVGQEHEDRIGLIELKTVMNGAGPILIKMNELIEEGKKLIVVDAVSTTNIEQVVLAINKCSKKLLPTGTAAFANILANVWLGSVKKHEETIKLPILPKLILSGSATKITANQIEHLQSLDEHDENKIYTLALKADMILENKQGEIVEIILNHLGRNNTVVIHTSRLMEGFAKISDFPFSEETPKELFFQKITDFLGFLAQEIVHRRDVILITLGGETSYKCCKNINSTELTIIDEATPAIALTKSEQHKFIVTKSGNLGNGNTLVDILKYIEANEQ